MLNPLISLPHSSGPRNIPPERRCGECRRLEGEGRRALLGDDLDALKAVNERRVVHYTEAHAVRALVR
ncbi:hypothetical protein ACH427_24940 [Streptomyces sp. NPDC020379]|uniref:hypothetical protein n=1 Tax=Streptomyces sp. NPDC020379 TaxID=3365071 RepID=UPI0037AFBDC8